MTRPSVSLMLSLSDPERDKNRPISCPGGDFDWRSWLSAAEKQGVLPIISKNFEGVSPGNVPAWVIEEAARSYTAAWARNMFLENEIEEFARALSETEIRAIVLKGPALAESVYPEMGMRPFTDIDLLIARDAVPEVCALLRRMGYKPDFTETEMSAEDGLRKTCFQRKIEDLDSCIEVHWDAVNSPSLRARCSVKFADLSPDARPWSACPALSFPCPEDSLITCLIHLAVGHRFDRLVLFVDVLQILRRTKSEFDWPKFFHKADRYGAGLVCASALRLTDDLFPLPISPEYMKEIRRRLRLPWLWKLVLNGQQAANCEAWGTWVRLHIYREMIKRFGGRRL